MYGLYYKLLEEFGINTLKLQKTKGFFVATCENKQYALKKSFDTSTEISFQHEIMSALLEKDFGNVERLYKTRFGKPYATFGGDLYVLTDYICGGEVDFDDHIDKIINILSCFHEKSVKANLSSFGFCAPDLRQTLTKTQGELIGIKRGILGKGSLSDFDLSFMKNFDYYIKAIAEAQTLLKMSDYSKRLQFARERGSVCHNLLKKDNFVVVGSEIWISGFSGCNIDYYAADLAMLINRYIKYSKNRKLSAAQIIENYSKNKAIDKKDYAIILAHLLYPQSFLSPVRNYYSKKRSWTPSSVAGKMEEVLELKLITEAYINEIRNML